MKRLGNEICSVGHRLRHTGVPLNSVVELARLSLDDLELEDEGVAE